MMEFLLMWLMFHLFVVIRNIVLVWCLHLNCIIAASQFIEFIFCCKLEASITKSSCPPVWMWRLRQKTVRLKPRVVFCFFSPYANHSFQSTTTCTCTTSYHISASETFTCELVRRTWRQVVRYIYYETECLVLILMFDFIFFFLWNFTFYPEVRFWLLRFEQLDDETWCRHELSGITQAHASAEVSWWLVKHSLFSFSPP